MAEAFKIGEAPWEQAQSFKIGEAPWEVESEVATDSLFDTTPPSFQVDTQTQPTYQTDIQATETPAIAAQEARGQASEIRSNVENIQNKYSTILKQGKGIWNEEARKVAETEINEVRLKVLDELQAQGIENPMFVDGQLYATIDGKQELVETGLIQDMWKSKFEIAGAITGATAGASYAPPHPVAKLAGGLVGGAVGAFGGRGADILVNQIDLVNKVDDKLLLDQMTEAGVADAVMGVVGAGVFKGVASSGRYMKRIYDQVLGGNLDGAYKHALDHYGVSDAQAKQIVAKVETLVGELKGTDQEKAIRVLAETQAGGEAVVKTANIFDPTANAKVAQEIFKRAEDLRTQTSNLSAPNVANTISTNLDNYVKEVQDFYVNVKSAGDDVLPDYRFEFDKTALDPITSQIGKNIEDPVIKQRYLDVLTRIDEVTTDRSFSSLIDLRQEVNKLKYASKSITKQQKDSLDLVLKGVDSEIDRVSKDLMPGGDIWKKEWDKARVAYSDMKKLEDNVLYKSLTAPGVDEDTIVKTLSKYISAEDNTFFQVMEKLPKNVRNRVEGTVLNELVEKFAIGEVGGNRAIHFPKLAQAINKAHWSSPKVKQLTRTVNRMAEVFKNDVNLARVSGNITVPKFQSYLTTDPIVRMKFEIASGVFNYIKQIMPGDQSNALALAKNTGKLLEDPLNARTISDLKRALPKERRSFREKLDFEPVLQELRQEYIHKRNAWEQTFGRPVPPQLVWKQPKESPQQVLDSLDEVLFATQRGTVAGDPTSAIMKDRADDLLQEFLLHSTNRSADDIVEKASKYITKNGVHLDSVIKSTKAKLKADDRVHNAKMVANIIKLEAERLRRSIEKDFGVRFGSEEAEKFIKLKFKETFNECM